MCKFTLYITITMRRITVLCVLLIPILAFGQSKHPQVLVYGSGADAFAAAMQSAMSNLNTVWLSPDDKLVPELTTEMSVIEHNHYLDGGIWATVLAHTMSYDERNDSVSTIAKKRINPQIVENTINELIGRYPNLTLIRGAELRQVSQSRRYWRIELSNRTRYRVRTLVDASASTNLFQMALPDSSANSHLVLTSDYFNADAYEALMRTGVAVSDLGHPPFSVPLATLVPNDDNNIFPIRNLPVMQQLMTGTISDVPLLMHVGQAIGAAAAYVAFYETTSDKIDLRSIQSEIIQYGARLIPFQDIPIESPHFQAIQRVGATGLLPGQINANGLFSFIPEGTVSTQEIAPVMDRLYSRSQIWFTDHQADTMRMSDLLDLIKYVSHRGNELEGHVEKNWQRRFLFNDSYDANMTITRRHFAVLMDAYCKPFDVKVGLDGTIYR